ncbi:RNA-binding domain-containing protein [Lichtheimia hyalospora FSU 10163]|nr:RNA-binding domain-containing protein [Lichtheimia hyalospora FSU 10163]
MSSPHSGLSMPFFMASTENTKTTLWMGDLEPWMDEQFITQLWYNLGENVMVKVIRDKVTSMSAGYAFVDFGSSTSAAAALSAFNGTTIPNTCKTFKLNWASGGGLIDRREDRQPEYSIFVGDLGDCNEATLLSAFATRYRSCKYAKIMNDPRTGLSRGYGFVRFSDAAEHQHALVEMQGCCIRGRPVRVSMATPKHYCTSFPSSPPTPPTTTTLADPHNTTVFVGGLSAPITEDELQQYFMPFGDIVYTKIPPGKGCGFVQYVSRISAESAILCMNGYQIGNSRIRLSWGRSQNDKSAAAAAATAAAAQASRQQQNHLRHHQHRLPPPSLLAASDWLGGHTDQKHQRSLFTTTSSFGDTNNTNAASSPWSFNHIYAQ